MSVTVKKQLSLAKELFLSIALVAQEISSETIKMMNLNEALQKRILIIRATKSAINAHKFVIQYS